MAVEVCDGTVMLQIRGSESCSGRYGNRDNYRLLRNRATEETTDRHFFSSSLFIDAVEGFP